MKIPGRLTGSDPLARWLNSLRDYAISCRITSFQGGYMSTGANGTQLVAVPTSGRGGSGTTITAYKIASNSGDYITCHTWDGSTEGEVDIIVAKPKELRHSETSFAFGGVTITYDDYDLTAQTRAGTRSTDSSEIIETVVRPYQAGDIIYAAVVDWTGVTVSEIPITKIDLNLAARHWAEKWA
jgi:hypothetical protein